MTVLSFSRLSVLFFQYGHRKSPPIFSFSFGVPQAQFWKVKNISKSPLETYNCQDLNRGAEPCTAFIAFIFVKLNGHAFENGYQPNTIQE